MQKKTLIVGLLGIGVLGFFTLDLSIGILQGQARGSKNTATIERGEWLVTLGGCNDCHSPKVLTPYGPVVDTSRLLSGYPADSNLPEIPPGVIAPDQWGALTTHDITAWAGPWGVSFATNLTPDVLTGIGGWTDDVFIKAMRTGKHMGEGRDILPPMPWFNLARLSDSDLKAMFAYLKSLEPIENPVPHPLPPPTRMPKD